MSDNHIYSVSQLNQSVRQMLEGQLGMLWLTGEISNFSQPVSGHWYLTLKDENAQVRSAMFRTKNLRVTFKPQNGMQVLVRATVSLYEPRGDYQLIIESMHPAGEGLLQQQFEALKMKLAAEGSFSQNHKKNLPHFSKTVGIITSPSGAALQDILQILQRRDPSLKVVIYPTAVQGKDATAEIVQMIELANRRNETDVLIVGRGGGSLEDLWCFNEEAVARAIFNSRLPIISAVGHETDVTIADFVADARAPTPSAAAELVSRNQDELLQQLAYKQQRLEMALDRLFNEKSQTLRHLLLRLQHQHPKNRLATQQQWITQLEQRLQRALDGLFNQKSQTLRHLLLRLQNQHPKTRLRTQQQRIIQLEQRLSVSMQRNIDKTGYKLTALCARLDKNPLPFYVRKQHQHLTQLKVRLDFLMKKNLTEQQHLLANLCGKLDGLSPLKVLARGYSITENQAGKAVTSIAQVKAGETLRTRVVDGIIYSKVEKQDTVEEHFP